jgi:glucosylceramidase
MWFQVDMTSQQTFGAVSLDSGGQSSDYPAGCDIAVSNDGSTWQTIASPTPAASPVVVPFASQNAQYIRVTLNSGASGTSYWWSIAEFNVLY